MVTGRTLQSKEKGPENTNKETNNRKLSIRNSVWEGQKARVGNSRAQAREGGRKQENVEERGLLLPSRHREA